MGRSAAPRLAYKTSLVRETVFEPETSGSIQALPILQGELSDLPTACTAGGCKEPGASRLLWAQMGGLRTSRVRTLRGIELVVDVKVELGKGVIHASEKQHIGDVLKTLTAWKILILQSQPWFPETKVTDSTPPHGSTLPNKRWKPMVTDIDKQHWFPECVWQAGLEGAHLAEAPALQRG